MGRPSAINFEFVDSMPPTLSEEAKVYISIRHRTTAHLCLCGCGEKVVNPLRPQRWSLTYNGETISMSPSIGNSGLACKSHYWIKKNKVEWWPPLTGDQVSRGLSRDGWSTHPQAARRSGDRPAAQTKGPWWRRFPRLRRRRAQTPE